jgi:AraC-like DNA-binding protein
MLSPLVQVSRALHAAGAFIDDHTHPWGQLAFVTHGTMLTETDNGCWLTPPGQSVWVPPGVRHSAKYSEASALINLRLDPLRVELLPKRCHIIGVTQLLHELALELVHLIEAKDDNLDMDLISRLIIQLLLRPQQNPSLFIPLGRDRRLRVATQFLQNNPGHPCTIDDVARFSHTSVRTLGRLFSAETGLSFARWRDRLRIVIAVDQLARGRSIMETADALGYQSPSSFSTMFSRVLGVPPGRYMARIAKQIDDKSIDRL